MRRNSRWYHELWGEIQDDIMSCELLVVTESAQTTLHAISHTFW